MDCCEDKNITKVKSEFACMNYGVIHDYEYVHFNYDNDYDSILNNIIKYKKSCYKRRKYLITKCNIRININIIYFLDECLEIIRLNKNMKRIPINKYLNNLYKYYCKKAGIEYQDLIVTKNNFSINEENFNETYEKYKYVERNEDDIFYL